ncbi:MAG: hypothetical protein MI746_04560 [Pseudomonadales bacterium]|nr:hypothetical protein [Pseudomonadales bacterium]
MEAGDNFLMIWLIYGLAACVFYWVFWRITAFNRQRWISYSLRALMLTLIATPWYANVEGTTLAPALMVVTLDAITIGLDAAGRGLVPLVLALIVAEFVATLMYFFSRKSKKA